MYLRPIPTKVRLMHFKWRMKKRLLLSESGILINKIIKKIGQVFICPIFEGFLDGGNFFAVFW